MDITLYTTHCPQCEVLKKKLDSADIEYSVCDDVDVMAEKGFLSAPILEVDGKSMIFKDAVNWVNGGSNK